MDNLAKTGAGILAAGALATGGVTFTDAQINPYVDNTVDNKYELAIELPEGQVDQGEKVSIAKDKAQMTMTGWNGEYSISITPLDPSTDQEIQVEGDRPLMSKELQYQAVGPVKSYIAPKEGSPNQFDIDFSLESKPATNVFKYRIDGAEDFDFFYQPPLTEEINDPPTVSCTETQCVDGEGNITAERPENVVGSYAVYSKDKANHAVGQTNYGTGKVAHIYRPQATDANGESVWASLNYENGVLSVTVPQKFLDTAVYPVVVDPTFGYTTVGGTTGFSLGSNTYNALTYNTSVAVDAVVTQIDAVVFNGSGVNWKGIVSDSSYNILTNGISPAAASDTAAPYNFRTTTFTNKPILTGGSSYYLGVICNATGFTAYDTGSSGDMTIDTTNSYTSPVNSSHDTSNNHRWSIYATYYQLYTGTQTITTAGSYYWTPGGTGTVDVELWGGGGGGTQFNDTGDDGGAGGGAYSKKTAYSVTSGTYYLFVVGAGGTEGVNGGDSYFINTSTVLAKGGSTGIDGSTAPGGQASDGVGDTKYSGGTGHGGGGSGAGTGSNGNDASFDTGGAAPTGGGKGGDGDSSGSFDGENGSAPAGGGGGVYSGFTPGNGAAGKAIFTFTPSGGGGGGTPSEEYIILFD